MAKIVIDPICVDLTINGIPLSAINLNLAKNIYDYLLQVLNSDQIAITRVDNSVCPVPIETRLTEANKSDVQLIISVGADNFTDAIVNGFEIIRGASAGAQTFANGILQQSTNLRTKWGLSLKFTEPITPDFIGLTFPMISATTAPAVLVMPGFISNTHDFDVLTNFDFQKEFGFTIAQAISSYLGLGTIEFSPIAPPTTTPPITQEEQTGFVSPLPFIIAGAAAVGLIAAIVLSKKK